MAPELATHSRGITRRNFLAVSALCIAASAIAAASADEVNWDGKTHAVRMTDGRITSLFDKSSQTELILPQIENIRGMFRVTLNREFKKALEVDSSAIQLSESAVENGVLRMMFQSEHLRAVVAIQNGSDDDSLQWNIEVTPLDKGLSIAQVVFPVLHMRAPLGGDSANDRIVFPLREGQLIHDPLRGLESNQPVHITHPYPANLVGQFMGYFCDRAGCLLWTDDTQGHVKWFGFEREKNESGLLVFVDHRMPFEAGATWRMPYHVRTSLFAKNWQAGAEIYRAWAARQFWCKTRLEDRQDIASLLRAPCLVVSSDLPEEDIGDLPHRLEDYRNRFKIPVVYRPVGWEKYGQYKHVNWTGIDYFPPFLGEAKFKQLVAALREREVYTSAFLVGHYWTTHHNRLPAEANAALEKFYEENDGDAVAERLPDGTVWSALRQGVVRKVRVCSGTSLGRTMLSDQSRRVLDYGVVQVHVEHDFGPQPCGDTCYSPSQDIPCRVGVGRPTACATRSLKSNVKEWLATRTMNSQLASQHGSTTRRDFLTASAGTALAVGAEELLHVIERVDSPQVGVCLDTGNPLGMMEDPLETARKLAPHVVTTHLKDWKLGWTQRGYQFAACRMGKGVVDNASIIRLLAPMYPDLHLNIQSPAFQRFEVPVFEDDYWRGLPDLRASHLARFIHFMKRTVGDARADDWRTPIEQEWPEDKLLKHEDDMVRHAVSHVRRELLPLAESSK